MGPAKVRVGVNGFGRIGRLAFRLGWDHPDFEFVHVNEGVGALESSAYLLEFDSVHGRWDRRVTVSDDGGAMVIDGRRVGYSQSAELGGVDWGSLGCDVVLSCDGVWLSHAQLQAQYLDRGVKKVVVSAPVKDGGVLNVVYGVNDDKYDPARDTIITAASCTTNCLAPVVQVVHSQLGIVRGSITTIHNVTNTQTIVDAPNDKKSDLRRARAGMLSLAPTTTGSATAIALIFPELKGKLNGHAVRVPLLNGSLTDCVFEVSRGTTAEEVNGLLRAASEEGRLKGILGFETQPLVSVDYVNDTRSGIVDAPSTMVVDGTHVKLYVWYDNEFGYSARMVDCAAMVARSLATRNS